MQFLTVTGSGFDSNARVAVRFSDGGKYSVDVPPVSVEPSKIVVAVPPFVDVSSGRFSSGKVSVSVAQTPSGAANASQSNAIEGFSIEALPSPKAAAGTVALAYFEGAAAHAQALLTEVKGTILDTAEVNAALESYAKNFGKIAAAIRATVENSSEFSIGSADGEELLVGLEELRDVDRLIYAMALAQSSGSGSSLGAARLQAGSSGGRELFFADAGCMAVEAGYWADDINTGNQDRMRSSLGGYLDAPMASVNCMTSEAVVSGVNIVIGSGEVAAGLIALAGLPVSPLAVGVLTYVGVFGGGGLVLVGGTLGKDSPGAMAMVVRGAGLVMDRVSSFVRTGTISALGKYSSATAHVAEAANAVGDLIEGAFHINDALEAVPEIQSAMEAAASPTPGATPSPSPAVFVGSCPYIGGDACRQACCSTGASCKGVQAYRTCNLQTGDWEGYYLDPACDIPCLNPTTEPIASIPPGGCSLEGYRCWDRCCPYVDVECEGKPAYRACDVAAGEWYGDYYSDMACTVPLPAACAVATPSPSPEATPAGVLALEVKKSGSGSGVVVSEYGKEINCGTDCSEVFDYERRSYTLRAKPANGSTLGGWIGECELSSHYCDICYVNMTKSQTVTAVFEKLTATIEPAGCVLENARESLGKIVGDYKISVRGTAAGPVNSSFFVGAAPSAGQKSPQLDCGSWSEWSEWGYAKCRREQGQPADTAWTWSYKTYSEGLEYYGRKSTFGVTLRSGGPCGDWDWATAETSVQC
jgi:hypothetical protein